MFYTRPHCVQAMLWLYAESAMRGACVGRCTLTGFTDKVTASNLFQDVSLE